MLLTALLALLLTTSVPAALEKCCQPKASCCSGKCNCHISSPISPQTAAEVPALIVHAPTVALLAVFSDDHECVPTSSVLPPVALLTGRESPRYILTHALLI